MTLLDLILAIITFLGLALFPWPFSRRTTNVTWHIDRGSRRRH